MMTVERAWMSPREALEEIVLCLGQSARDKGLELRSEAGKDVPDRIEADPLRFRQIMTNLIANAIKFTIVGSITVAMDCSERNGERRLEISVTDTGIGIEPAKQQILFQSFQQADPSISRAYGGSGLGLVLGRRFASLMDGDLKLAQSAVGTGSTFVLSLPLAGGPAPKQQAAGSAEGPLAGRLGGVRILLAEDSDELRFLYRGFLESEGAEVFVAADGEEALRAADAGQFDLLLMDVNMPRLGGIEATRRLRGRGFRLPILALTAHALGTHDAECRAAGFDGSLYKPFYPETLTEAVMRAIGR
jgi:CheY-like chemotaxis protein